MFWRGAIACFTTESYAAFLTEVLAQTDKHLILIQDGARYHASRAMKDFFEEHAEHLTMFQSPSYLPDFSPIEHLWRNVKKQATHLKYFPVFTDLIHKVENTLQQCVGLPDQILSIMGRYYDSLGITD